MRKKSLTPSPIALDISGYSSQDYNILAPVLKPEASSPYLRSRAVEVRLEAEPRKGDCYPAPGAQWERDLHGAYQPNLVALAKPGLLKIASAAGLVLDTENSLRITPDACARCLEMARATGQGVRCADCPGRYDVAYQHIGAVRTDCGWRVLKSSYEWNLEAQRRKLLQEAKKREMRSLEATGGLCRPFDLESYVEERLDQILAERFSLAETKSLLRLVRAICHVRQTYTREEMAKPFIVIRTELAPDLLTPAMRKSLAKSALASGAEIFQGVTVRPALRRRKRPALADRGNASRPTERNGGILIEQLANPPNFFDAQAKAQAVCSVKASP